MKRVLFIYFAIVMVLFGLISCNDNPTGPQSTFPIEFTFFNRNDSSVSGGFDVHVAVYKPGQDSSVYMYGGLNSPAVGDTFSWVAIEDGYSGVEVTAAISAYKIWPDQGNGYRSKKWFCTEMEKINNERESVIHFTWPDDTAKAYVHEFNPDSVNDKTYPCF